MQWDSRSRPVQRRRRWPYFAILIILIASYVTWALYRPLPAIKPAKAAVIQDVQTPAGNLHWPAQAQSAVTILGSNIINTSGSQTPSPMASTAKVITALLVLNKKPLQPGQSGPTYTITADDVARYNNYASRFGSVVAVQTGEQLTEYQMLEAMMLPSANNIADTMAIWVFGSLGAYADAANSYLASHGITNTHVGSDASGLTPDTTTTAGDLVKIGSLAMQQPALTQIVDQASAAPFPVVNQIKNVNTLLGKNGIIGIKTGNSDQAGGVFLGAAKQKVNGKTYTIITAVVNAANLNAALNSSLSLIQSAEQNFTTTNAFTAGQTVGTYTAPWGTTRRALVRQNLTQTTWRSSTLTATISLHTAKPNSSQAVGTLKVTNLLTNKSQNLPVYLQNVLPPPTLQWRLLHPIN